MYSLIEHICPGCGLAGTAGRALLACLLSFVLTMAFAPRVIRALISLKIGQPIRTAEEVHKLAELHGAKAGTPTMGGVLIVGATLAATLLCARMGNPFIISCLFVTVALGLLGFRDDYLKVTKKTSDGISARKKLIVQVLWVFWASLSCGCIRKGSRAWNCTTTSLPSSSRSTGR